MTRSDHPHRDAEKLDQALDALMKGDHSGLDDLPPEMAATISRLMWLAREGADIDEPDMRHPLSADVPVAPAPWLPGSAPMPPATTGPGLPEETPTQGHSERTQDTRNPHQAGDRPVAGIGPSQHLAAIKAGALPTPQGAPSGAPVSERTRKAAGIALERPDVERNSPTSRPRSRVGMNALLRVAAILLVLVLAGGTVYGVISLQEQDDLGNPGDQVTDELYPQLLQPGRCNAEPVDRDYALRVLRDVDVERDEALRRATLLRPVDLSNGEVAGYVQLFVNWQSCRRFGSTYEAMALQAPYFTREDFYGETTLDFRGPVETAYSDATLNEMLDRREELDATSRQYWENAGHYPSPSETLVVGGEEYATDDGQFIAIRAVAWNMDSGEWTPTTTIVVFQFLDGEYKIFDIQSTPPGTPPYL